MMTKVYRDDADHVDDHDSEAGHRPLLQFRGMSLLNKANNSISI